MCAWVRTTASRDDGSKGKVAQFLSQPLVALEQPAVDQHTGSVGFDEIARASDGVRSAKESDA